MTKTLTVKYAGGYGSKEVTLPGPFETLAQIKQANEAVGHHYFERATMRFFRSKPVRSTIAGRFFIDSIQFVGSNYIPADREYKVCLVADDGKIDNVYFGDRETTTDKNFKSLTDARRAIRELIRTAIDRNVPTYDNQLWHARKLLADKGIEALNNPHAMVGRNCKCGSCFCCAAAQVVAENSKTEVN